MGERVSIVVPVYNVQEYLKRCVDSILAQTYENMEIILVDDGSKDSSGQICDNYAEKDNRIRVIHKENGGSNSARLAGVRAAMCEYICFVDSDDWIEPVMIEKMMEAAEREQADIVASGIYVDEPVRPWIWRNGIRQGVYKGKALHRFYANMIFSAEDTHGIMLGMVCKIYRTQLLLKNLETIDPRIYYGEDAACVFLCCLDAKCIVMQDACWYHYVTRDTSVSARKDERIFQNNCLFYNALYNRFMEHEDRHALIHQLRKYVLVLNNKAIADMFQIHYERVLWEFPFEMFPAGSRIVIYGAGNIGKAYVHQLQLSSYCTLAMWIDKNVEAEGVQRPESLRDCEYDYILVAIKNPDVVREVKNELKKLGIWESEIIWKEPVKGSDSMYAVVELENGMI